MVDIVTGDILVIDSNEYAIKKANHFTLENAQSPSFTSMASVDCSTKRIPDPVDGKVGAPATNLTGLKCLPLSPIGQELAQSVGLETYKNIYETEIADDTELVKLYIEDPKS